MGLQKLSDQHSEPNSEAHQHRSKPLVGTGANQQAVRNWFDGVNGPNGKNLVILMQHSEQVLQVVLQLSGRTELLLVGQVMAMREQVRALLQSMDGLHPP